MKNKKPELYVSQYDSGKVYAEFMMGACTHCLTIVHSLSQKLVEEIIRDRIYFREDLLNNAMKIKRKKRTKRVESTP